MDPFTNLPTEIILQVLSHTTDFVGFESLISTSSWVNAVFRSQPYKVTLDLIRSNSITTMPEIQQLLRNIAIIKSPLVHCDNLESYLHLCANSQTNGMPDSALNTLPEQMTTREILHIIHIAANIQRLACMCLYTMQQNFISAVTNSLGSAAALRAAEPIVWIEEYRVYWALWHLQHYSALLKTAKHRWSWSKASLSDLGYTYITWNTIHPVLSEQIWTVTGILADMGLRPLYGRPLNKKGSAESIQDEDSEEGHEEEPLNAAWDFPVETPMPVPFFLSLELPLGYHSHYNDNIIWGPAPVPDDNSKMNSGWYRTPRFRLQISPSAGMIRSHTLMINHRPGFKQAREDLRQIRPFRRIGVVLWNSWRMYSVGLLSSTFRGRTKCTPDGGFVDGNDFRLGMYDISSRWLALIEKPPPVVGENYENQHSTVAKIINPRQ